MTGARTAAVLVETNIVIVKRDMPAGAVRQELGTGRFAIIDPIMVTEDDGRYVGVADLKSVLGADADTPMGSLLHPAWPHIDGGSAQELAASIAHEHGVTAVPVVGDDNCPAGLIPAHALLDVVAREHRQDLHRIAGIMSERAGARHALEDPPFRRVAQRLPWLLVGLALSSLATMVMANFERAIEANVSLAFFIPALVYLTDAIGTQSEAIAVRGLSIRRRPLGFILSNEIFTGAIIGLALGAVAFVGVTLFFSDSTLALGVSLTLLFAGTIASSLGLVLPWIFARLGADPAFGAGPVATIIQDSLTILIYFVVMAKVLAN